MAQKVIIELSGHDASRVRTGFEKLIDYDLMREHRIAIVKEIISVLFGNGFA